MSQPHALSQRHTSNQFASQPNKSAGDALVIPQQHYSQLNYSPLEQQCQYPHHQQQPSWHVHGDAAAMHSTFQAPFNSNPLSNSSELPYSIPPSSLNNHPSTSSNCYSSSASASSASTSALASASASVSSDEHSTTKNSTGKAKNLQSERERARLRSHHRYNQKRRRAWRENMEQLQQLLLNDFQCPHTAESKVGQTKRIAASAIAAPSSSNSSSSLLEQVLHWRQEPGDSNSSSSSNSSPVDSMSTDPDGDVHSLISSERSSSICLIRYASHAIRMLSEMKSKLEDDITQLHTDPQQQQQQQISSRKRQKVKNELNQNDAMKEESDEEALEVTAAQTTDSAELNNMDTVIVNNSSSSLPSVSPEEQTTRLRFLLSAVVTASQGYSSQLARIDSLLTHVPRRLHDASDFLPPFSCLGLNGLQILSILRPNVLKQHTSMADLPPQWTDETFQAKHGPTSMQLYAFCAVLNQDYSLLMDAPKLKLKNGPGPAPKDVLGFLKQSQFHSASSPSSPLPLTSAGSSSSSALCLSESSLPVPMFSDSDFDSASDHPLTAFGISASHFQSIQRALRWLASLDEQQYEEQVKRLWPLARSMMPLESLRVPASCRVTADDIDRTPLDYTFHPVFTPSYSQIQSFHELFNGIKPLVTMTGLRLASPSNSILYADMDFVFLRHAKSQVPLAIVYMLRRFYEGEPLKDSKWHDKEKKWSAVINTQQAANMQQIYSHNMNILANLNAQPPSSPPSSSSDDSSTSANMSKCNFASSPASSATPSPLSSSATSPSSPDESSASFNVCSAPSANSLAMEARSSLASSCPAATSSSSPPSAVSSIFAKSSPTAAFASFAPPYFGSASAPVEGH